MRCLTLVAAHCYHCQAFLIWRHELLLFFVIYSMISKAIIHDADEGGYWAEVPVLPGCFTEGDTLDEVKKNLKEAISGILDYEVNLL